MVNTCDLSIIVPVYNMEKYLVECLDSILSQDYKDIEIIAINDGSTDKSGYILDEYAKKNEVVRVIHKDNGGLSSARNIGLKNARGKYVGFVDSDDIISHRMFYNMMKLATENDLDVVVCGMKRFSNTEELQVLNNLSNEIDTHNLRILTGTQLLECLLRNEISNSVCNKIFRKSLFEGIDFPEGKYYEDQAVLHTVFGRCDKGCQISNSLYYYRDNASSITKSSFSEKRFDWIDAALSREEYIKDNYPQFQALAGIQVINVYLNLIHMLAGLPKNNYFRSKLLGEFWAYYRSFMFKKSIKTQLWIQIVALRINYKLYDFIINCWEKIRIKR